MKDSVVITLREATEADSMLLLEWRNSPEVRRWTFSPEPIPAEVHERWLAGVLKDKRRSLLVAEADGEPVGVVRIDLGETEGEAEIHVYIGPEHHGKGLGGRVIDAACSWARDTLGIRKVLARIMPGNAASVRAFEKAGFRHTCIVMERTCDGD